MKIASVSLARSESGIVLYSVTSNGKKGYEEWKEIVEKLRKYGVEVETLKVSPFCG